MRDFPSMIAGYRYPGVSATTRFTCALPERECQRTQAQVSRVYCRYVHSRKFRLEILACLPTAPAEEPDARYGSVAAVGSAAGSLTRVSLRGSRQICLKIQRQPTGQAYAADSAKLR